LKIIKYIAIVIILASVYEANSQTCCTGSAPITGSVSVSPIEANQWLINLSVDYNNISDLIQENVNTGDDYLSRTTTTLLLQGSYGFGKGFGVSVLIPFVQHSENITSLGDINTTRNAAVGDLAIFLQKAIAINTTSSFLFGAAIKLPSGSTQAKDQDDLFILPPTLQAGTGSTDYILMIRGQKSMAFRRSMLIQQSFTYRFNTLSTRFASHDNYQFGDEFYSISSIADQLVTGSIIHTPSLSLNIRYAGQNVIEQYVDPNSGGWWFNIRPGWGVNLTPKLNLSILYEVPMFRRLNGFQLTTSYKIIGVINIKI